ncbi:MAG: tRNA (N(6)-L-threonylcarbamoyladenosine(37)-C(2))-methylthiotransferase MtaB [Eggerthellaceae bacterium]|jgi:threonylcarbamoyladenosine tRNA methylthiotransferase MtaB
MMNSRSCAVINLGCKVNRVETDSFLAFLLAQGFKEEELSSADLILVNTCTVTAEAEKKTRKAVHHALRENPDAEVLVTGCAAAISAEEFRSMSPRVRVLGKASVMPYLEDLSAELSSQDSQVTKDARKPYYLRLGSPFHERVNVKVQDGCDNACSFCIVHVARGKSVSYPKRRILGEVSAYAQAGTKEIILTGINLGAYEVYEDATSYNLVDLLSDLLEETKDFTDENNHACRFRLSSIEPKNITDELIDFIAASQGRICRHLHLPLQSGSTKVLKEMNRPYSAEEYWALVDKLYEKIPELTLSTDMICGFPGESQEDFEDSLKMARACRFAKIHVFPYSEREGTPAASRTDQVEKHVRQARAKELRDLAQVLRKEAWDQRSGMSELVLVESSNRGMTESYFEVHEPMNAPVGSLIPYEIC